MRLPGIIFDLDGTLVDSVYQHVRVWHEVLCKSGIVAAQWRIHGAIGMSGDLFLPKLLRDIGHSHSNSLVARLQSAHAKQFSTLIGQIQPLTGATQLLKLLRRRNIPFAVATSGNSQHTKRLLKRVAGPACPVITSEDVAAAKPAPDLFELAASRLEKEPRDCFVVGDSVWDVLAGRRMNAAVIALRSGGFDGALLQQSGAYRVYADPLELSESLEQLGFSPASTAKHAT
jgi:HAD superfamily hydrolase (TIGR01549 family)